MVWMARSLCRLRWKPTLAVATLTVVNSLAIAAIWLWFDRKSMSSIEHYDPAGFILVVFPGAYAAAILSIIAVVFGKTYKLATRSRGATETTNVVRSTTT